MLVAALMISIGAQWVVLQSAAWVGMAVSYSLKTGSITVGLSETFDGEHPCPLCKAVSKAKQGEKKNAKFETVKKIELFANSNCAIVFPSPPSTELPRAGNEAAAPRYTAPPVPPPRCGQG